VRTAHVMSNRGEVPTGSAWSAQGNKIAKIKIAGTLAQKGCPRRSHAPVRTNARGTSAHHVQRLDTALVRRHQPMTVAINVAKPLDSDGLNGRFRLSDSRKSLTMDAGGSSGQRASELRTRRRLQMGFSAIISPGYRREGGITTSHCQTVVQSQRGQPGTKASI
jgi:hypothetical protein